MAALHSLAEKPMLCSSSTSKRNEKEERHERVDETEFFYFRIEEDKLCKSPLARTLPFWKRLIQSGKRLNTKKIRACVRRDVRGMGGMETGACTDDDEQGK